MTKREWLCATWAEWAPDYRAGRLDLGRLVITTRRQLQVMSWESARWGIELEQTNPGAVARTLAELNGEAPEGVRASPACRLTSLAVGV